MSNQNEHVVKTGNITIEIPVGVDRFGEFYAFALHHISFEESARLISGKYPSMQIHRVQVTLSIPEPVQGEVVNGR